jgi:LuxR family maltose regulon positive regulatory protein
VHRHVIAKLVAPRAKRIVRRARVLSAIDRTLRAGACWVAAPAGYGKTIAITDYVQKAAVPYIWYRVDEGDQDVASFFHYMALSVQGGRAGQTLPAFGAEYADQLFPFARRFFRAYLARLRPGTLLVLDDLHHADVPPFRQILAILLHELPPTIGCACLSRTLPSQDLTELTVKGRLAVLDESVLRFSEREARALVRMRVGRPVASISVAPACGWAAGLVLLAEHASAAGAQATVFADRGVSSAPDAFAALAGQLIDSLPRPARDLLMKVSLLPEVKPEIVRALGGETAARDVLDALHRRQLLVTRGASSQTVFHLHDLLREYLRNRLAGELPAPELATLMEQAARVLHDAGYIEAATDLAIQSHAWPLARRLITTHAETLLAQGRRATLIDRCAALPPDQLDAWLCYWLGVANAPDDAIAESWFARAWARFSEQDDARGLCLTAAHAVLSKADSWRTHEGLAVWTKRAIELLDRDVPGLVANEQLLAWTGMLRAVDFAATYQSESSAVERLTRQLVERLANPEDGDTATRRLFASEALIEHAGTTGQRDLFDRAVDSVAADLRDRSASAWALGLWLVAFGAISARYFAYTRRGFPYASAEDALRAAIGIGERESLRGIEFGGLYHLQLQMKSRNDFTEFAALIKRLAEIADSRYTTQVAVVADCQAALHTFRRDFAEAHAACERFMTAIEAANEPPLERWPHFITKFQVLLAEGRAADAIEFLNDLLPLFSGALRQRTETCVLVAHACAAKWTRDPRYPQRLREYLQELRAANWPAILLNTPELLAELCADALELDIEPEFCRSLITRRALVPPVTRPARWPWPLRVHVLGEFGLDRDNVPVDLGPKPPSRSLDIVRVLAVAKDHTCAAQQLYDWLWPDADGDQAKAACEQALHRLRRLLGRVDLIVQREGKLRLAPDMVWVDLDHWEVRLARALRSGPHEDAALEGSIAEFPGPLLPNEPRAPWFVPAAERVRSSFIEVAMRLGKRLEQRNETQKACDVYQRALDIYPTSERCYEALLRARLSMGDAAGALEDYHRCERVLASTLQARPSPSIRALVARLLVPAATM